MLAPTLHRNPEQYDSAYMPPPPPSVALAEHLQFLASLPAEYITEFGKAALALLQQQAQGKMFANVLCGLHTWHGSAHALTCAPRLP